MLVEIYPSEISWRQLFEYDINRLLIELSLFRGFFCHTHELEFDFATVNAKLVFSHKYLDS